MSLNLKINKISIQNSCINNRINKSNKKADVFHKYNSSIYNSKNLYSKLGSISFGYKLKGAKNSHLDYFGANVDPVTKKTTFRVYSTKDKIELQIANKDHYKKYWENLSKEEENEIGLETYLMKKEGRVFEIRPEKIIKEGMLYRYKITDKDGNVSYAKDPRTYYQPHDAMGWSGVYNQNSYVWHDKKWQDGLDERKIKRTKDINDWGVESNMVISEKHIGTLGGYENAKKEIDKISKEGICNTVYFLPVGEFFGEYNIGYDEVDKFAPESSYGTPDELKSLVDYAHQKGINVILDVVPNHFGFIGSSVGQFADAQDETKNTGWGAALKFKDKDILDIEIEQRKKLKFGCYNQ